MKLSPTMEAVLLAMDCGCRLVGSGIGGATLLYGRITHAIGYQTHQALIRRGLVIREPRRSRVTMSCDWYLTERGIDAVRQIKESA